MASKRWLGYGAVVILMSALLYLPIRRELLDRGLIVAAKFRNHVNEVLTLWDDGRYEVTQSGATRKGKYTQEHYPDAPWISAIRLDTGLSLHVKYEDRVYRVEDIPNLAGADIQFKRD